MKQIKTILDILLVIASMAISVDSITRGDWKTAIVAATAARALLIIL